MGYPALIVHKYSANLAVAIMQYVLFEARIRLDLVKILARSGSKQKFDGPRLARLDK